MGKGLPKLSSVRAYRPLSAQEGKDVRKRAITDLVDRYNEIVEELETDANLEVELRW